MLKFPTFSQVIFLLHFFSFSLIDSTFAPQGYLYMRQRRNRGNVMIGLALGAFVFSVYSYSIWAVKQEDMSDVDERALIARQLEEKKLQAAQSSSK